MDGGMGSMNGLSSLSLKVPFSRAGAAQVTQEMKNIDYRIR